MKTLQATFTKTCDFSVRLWTNQFALRYQKVLKIFNPIFSKINKVLYSLTIVFIFFYLKNIIEYFQEYLTIALPQSITESLQRLILRTAQSVQKSMSSATISMICLLGIQKLRRAI